LFYVNYIFYIVVIVSIISQTNGRQLAINCDRIEIFRSRNFGGGNPTSKINKVAGRNIKKGVKGMTRFTTALKTTSVAFAVAGLMASSAAYATEGMHGHGNAVRLDKEIEIFIFPGNDGIAEFFNP
jgi:hypothetical protein